MTLFDILVGIPLMLLWFAGWPALALYVLRCHTALSWSVCAGIALLVGVAFAFFEVRFTASVPSHTMIPMTPDQRTIDRIGRFLVYVPWGVLSLLVALRCLRRRPR